MILLKMMGHQCMLYSLAMLLDESPETLVQELGHDGEEKWWEHEVPYCYRGYHIQEFVELCLKRGKGLVPIELHPRSGSAKSPHIGRQLYTLSEALTRFNNLTNKRCGILIGQSMSGGHACAWDGYRVFDPNGKTYGLEDFNVRQCWLLV